MSPEARPRRFLHGLLLGLVLLLPAQASAQQRPAFLDDDLAVEIEANEAELSEEQDVSVYRGEVVLRRGPLTMQGDELRVVRRPADGRIQATLSGTPATATHRTPGDEVPVVAAARRIIYTTLIETLELKGEARIRRGSDELQGDAVIYDVANARIQAEGGDERVRIVITPPDNGDGP